jgi:MFS family permease
MDEFTGTLASLLALLVFFFVRGSGPAAPVTPHSKPPKGSSAGFPEFQRRYLLVYTLAMFSDWVQGPYSFRLYQSYGLSLPEIGLLFSLGYLSSMVMGPVAGGLADRVGRRRMALSFCAIYALSALTKFSTAVLALVCGRLLSGVATSLLFSCFEAWLVREHTRRGFGETRLADTFSKCSQANGLSAIVAGLAATAANEAMGPSAPYLLAIASLAATALCVHRWWPSDCPSNKKEEGKGGDGCEAAQGKLTGGYLSAVAVVAGDLDLLMIGGVQSLFEGAMYTFVFAYTPAMEAGRRGDPLPLGVVFSSMMVCIMLGGALGRRWLGRGVEPANLVPALLAAGAASLAATVVLKGSYWVFLSCCAFEAVVGAYFPVIAVVRSRAIPDSHRAAILTLFRVPLNVFVLVIVATVKDNGPFFIMTFCVVALLVAQIPAAVIMNKRKKK